MAASTALVELGEMLRQTGYSFTTITPLSHARVLARASAAAPAGKTLRDIFGWSKPFERGALPAQMFSLLEACDAIEHAGNPADPVQPAGLLHSRVRFSTLGDDIYVHSAFPTTSPDAVFFGPDTYRFAALIERELKNHRTPLTRILDIGCGAGPGGITAARQCQATQSGAQLALGDINPRALDYAAVNARLAGLVHASAVHSDLYRQLDGSFDLILANPPYLIDADERTYRHGGGTLGTDLARRILVEGLPRLTPDGMLILYTGAPVVDGQDVFLHAVEDVLAASGLQYSYAEIDPDVFGEELDNPGYENVDRIAAVGLVVRKRVRAA